MKKCISKRLDKTCAVCGRKFKLISYSDRTYRGGHYFGEIPICTNKETKRMLRGGTRTEKLGNMTVEVFKINPKPFKHLEYWECPKCYWKK